MIVLIIIKCLPCSSQYPSYYSGSRGRFEGMAAQHVSIPKSFSEGDVREWFSRFEICCRANEWRDAKKALKLPTLLEGEPLSIWLEATEEEQAVYETMKEKIITKMAPMAFSSLQEFHNRKMLPRETISLYLFELKRLLDQAMTGLAKEARDQLLIHQFLVGLPESISRQLRATGNTKDLESLAERAKIMITAMEQERVSAISTKESEVSQLKEQIAELTEQVAALTTQKKEPAAPRRCFTCHQVGHLQRNCPNRHRDCRCFECGRWGHTAHQCWQGNDKGMPVRGSRYPQQ